jgi:hypothetical protein
MTRAKSGQPHGSSRRSSQAFPGQAFPDQPLPKPRQPLVSPGLAALQQSFQSAILTGDTAILDTLLDTSRTTRHTLFNVYRGGYAARLIGVLRTEYPLLGDYCGDEEFEVLARAYIAAHPSRTPNARWFGAELPAFLAAAEPYGEHAELAELASIEKALSEAFDAKDAPVLSLGGLARFPAGEWGNLVFSPHPAATRLDLSSNAFTIWQALSADETPPPPAALPSARHLLIWRQDGMSAIRALGDEEAMMWAEAARGLSFGALCEMIATFDTPQTAALRAAGYLQCWLNTQALTSARMSADN